VFDFKNKVAIVTGSSRGIGRSIALALARCGCAVTVNYRKSREKADEVVNSIRQMGGKAIAVKCDVSKREEVENLFTATVNAFNKVDILVNNYGKIVNISSNSGFGIAMPGDTSYAVSKAGVIQLTKSSAFELGRHNINVNCVAPGAVDTDMLREEARSDEEYEKLLEGRRNASSLGITGTPEDIANAVLFFASDESRYITGKTLLVDGGRRDFL
jgi:3-oxoacyl-[acyl-carrier protein] reductase